MVEQLPANGGCSAYNFITDYKPNNLLTDKVRLSQCHHINLTFKVMEVKK